MLLIGACSALFAFSKVFLIICTENGGLGFENIFWPKKFPLEILFRLVLWLLDFKFGILCV